MDSKMQPAEVRQGERKRLNNSTSACIQAKRQASQSSMPTGNFTDCCSQALVIEDTADALLKEPRFEAGSLLFEAVISFDVPNTERTEAASKAAFERSKAASKAANCRSTKGTDSSRGRIDAPMLSKGANSEACVESMAVSSVDQDNLPESIDPHRVPVEEAVLCRLNKVFQDSPSEAIKILAGRYIPPYELGNLLKLFSDIKCVSPASLAKVRPCTTFALCRALVHRNRANVVNSPDGYLMRHLLNQSPRVLRLIFGFASRLQRNSRASQCSSVEFGDLSFLRQFAFALHQETEKDSAVEQQRKYFEYRQNIKEGKKKRREEKRERCAQAYGSHNAMVMTSTSKTTTKNKTANRNNPNLASKPRGLDCVEEDSSESSDEDDLGNGKAALDVDSSKLSYSFSKIRQHVPTDKLHITLKVKLSSHAFSIPRSLRRLNIWKQQQLKRGYSTAHIYEDYDFEPSSENTLQNGFEVPMTTILRSIFPYFWNYSNPFSFGLSADEDELAYHSNIPPKDVPWERLPSHPSSKRPVNDRKHIYDSVSKRYEFKREKTEEEFADELSAWEDLQAEPPRDTRVPPPWVSISLRGSMGNGNGGWTRTCVTGADLCKDLLADSWRLPNAFPFDADTQQSPIETLMNELESLGHRTISHPTGMTVVLRDYQLGSISWMVDQERLPGGIHSHLFAPITTADKRRLWYSPILEAFRKEKPPFNVCGGFLADEMGLGKTVMVLGLVLSNPAPPSFFRTCPGNAEATISEAFEIELLNSSSSSSSSSSSNIISSSSSSTITSTSSSHTSADSRAATDVSPNGGSPHLTPPLVRSRATLVVCNVSLVGQWYDEASSKLATGQLSVYKYYGSNRTRDPAVLANYDIVVTTYAILASDLARSNAEVSERNDSIADEEDSSGVMMNEEDQSDKFNDTKEANVVGAKLGKKAASKSSKKKPRSFSKLSAGECSHPTSRVHWWRVVLDESHNIKDPTTAANQACTGLTSGRRWCVSGTPMTKNLSDLVGQFKFLGLAPLHKPAAFQAISGHSFKLLALLRRILIRHSKGQCIVRKVAGDNGTPTLIEEPILELPPLNAESNPLELDSAEMSAYLRMEKLARKEYLVLRHQGKAAVRSATLTITERILRPLRQACSGGEMVFKSNAPVSAIRADAASASSSSSERSEAAPVVMTTKLDALLAHVTRVKAGDPTSKCLIFTQFKPTLDLLCKKLPQHGFAFRTLTGDMSQHQREEALLSFRDDPPTTVFVLSIRAGAVGINLTEANHVFLLEPLLNPGLEKQAIGRVHRMGQRRAVTVTKFFINDSIESRLVQLLGGTQPSTPAATTLATTAVTIAPGEEGGSSSSSSTSAAISSSSNAKSAALVGQQQVVGHLRADEAKLSVEVLDFLLGVTPLHLQAFAKENPANSDAVQGVEDDDEGM